MDKEGENPQMISDLLLEPLEQVDVQEEEDPLGEENAQEDHQDHQEDHRGDHREEITIIEIGMISRETMKATT